MKKRTKSASKQDIIKVWEQFIGVFQLPCSMHRKVNYCGPFTSIHIPVTAHSLSYHPFLVQLGHRCLAMCHYLMNYSWRPTSSLVSNGHTSASVLWPDAANSMWLLYIYIYIFYFFLGSGEELLSEETGEETRTTCDGPWSSVVISKCRCRHAQWHKGPFYGFQFTSFQSQCKDILLLSMLSQKFRLRLHQKLLSQSMKISS